jgi:hypothetical protein
MDAFDRPYEKRFRAMQPLRKIQQIIEVAEPLRGRWGTERRKQVECAKTFAKLGPSCSRTRRRNNLQHHRRTTTRISPKHRCWFHSWS